MHATGALRRVPTIVLNMHLIEDVEEARKQLAQVRRDLSGPVDTLERGGGWGELDSDDSSINLENAAPARRGWAPGIVTELEIQS